MNETPESGRARPAPRRRSSLNRERILAVATEQFAANGYAAVSMRDIALACKVNLPSIYHFFGDKESLYQACYHETFEQAAAKLQAAIAGAREPRRLIDTFTEALCDVLMHDDRFRRLLQREFLREEHRRITALTTHHFQREFRALTDAIAQVYGQRRAMERCFAIYALALGLLQLRRIGELAGMDRRIASSPRRLARHVLGIVFPATPVTSGL